MTVGNPLQTEACKRYKFQYFLISTYLCLVLGLFSLGNWIEKFWFFYFPPLWIQIEGTVSHFCFRGGNASTVSKSVGVLDFSAKDKSGSAKPPRRFSNPAKASPTPGHKVASNITPISETRTGRTPYGQGRGKTTPISEISRTSSRVKLNLLTSPSYWLNQIKLSESAAKHSISLGFFKLALEAGCEVQ